MVLEQNVKNIMQVRKGLHKHDYYLGHLHADRHKEHPQQNSTSRSQRKSHRTNNNNNTNINMNKSKSKSKVSKNKYVEVLNTSPVLKSGRKSKRERICVKDQSYNMKFVEIGKEYETKCQTVSTKINTQRTPVKKIFQSPKKESGKKTKKTLNHTKSNKKNVKKDKNSQKQNKKEQKVEKKLKIKKNIPQISTCAPNRKQSYFDEQIIQKLNLDNAQFERRKRHHISPNLKINVQNQPFESNQLLQQSFQLQKNPKFKFKLKQCGTLTEENMKCQVSTFRDLQNFRKQQQLKWRIVCLQLSELKSQKKQQKIQSIIEESTKNISQFQCRKQQILEVPLNKCSYIFQSPTRIKNVLRNHRKSEQQIKQMVKNLSGQKLLQQLESIADVSQYKSNKIQQNPCSEFQKQLQTYSHEHIANQQWHKQDENPPINIPQIQYEKSQALLEQISNQLFIEFCTEMTDNQMLLHSFLLFLRNSQITKVQCSNSYSIQLVKQLFKFIKRQKLDKEVLQKINIPFGNTPQISLKWLRNFFSEDSNILQQQQQQIQPIISSDILTQFQSQKGEPTQGQYFFDHCIYKTVNDILDEMRPYGVEGLPTLQRVQNLIKVNRNLGNMSQKIIDKLKEILSVKMGRYQFEEWQTDPIQITQKAYKKIQKFMVSELQGRWGQEDDTIFQIKYFMAESVIQNILNEQILMIFNEFL